MGQKKRETRPSWRAQEPQQVDFGDEETVWSFLTYLPICDQLYILKRHKSVIFAMKSRSAKRICKYTNHLHELMQLCNTVREPVIYVLAEFVRSGGTPPLPP